MVGRFLRKEELAGSIPAGSISRHARGHAPRMRMPYAPFSRYGTCFTSRLARLMRVPYAPFSRYGTCFTRGHALLPFRQRPLHKAQQANAEICHLALLDGLELAMMPRLFKRELTPVFSCKMPLLISLSQHLSYLFPEPFRRLRAACSNYFSVNFHRVASVTAAFFPKAFCLG